MKILIVDDNRDNADTLARVLTRRGFEASTAYDGGQALVEMARFCPDLILLDLMMPNINGWEFLDSKVHQDDYRHIPVVLMSAYTEIDQPLPEGQVVAVAPKLASIDAIVALIEKSVPSPGEKSCGPTG